MINARLAPIVGGGARTEQERRRQYGVLAKRSCAVTLGRAPARVPGEPDKNVAAEEEGNHKADDDGAAVVWAV